MDHLNDDSLLDLLDSETDVPGARGHLEECAQCRRSLDELRGITELLKSGPSSYETPPEPVWQRVLQELDAPAEPARTDPGAARATGSKRGPGARGRGKWLLAVAAALVFGAVVGRLSVDSGDRGGPATTVLAKAPLDTLNQDAQRLGQATLTRTGSTTSVRVAMDSVPARGRIIEVWLINKDGRRMVSVGFMNGTEPQSFTIDPRLLDEGYVIVDVSREPLDGNPAHSGDSIVRGTLPV